MYRSVVGVLLVIFLATGIFVWQGVRAEALDSVPGTADFASAQVTAPSASLDSDSIAERVFSEPSTLLLMGAALFGAARLARRS